jgi:uncharacterized protein
MNAKNTNKLINETSPYLLQHAHNPVDWYPWSEESLELAKQLEKPILLSIGYSACHWCHVMAHESFEDNETAELMNKSFVNIKVDREERPDLDKIYQTGHQLLTQNSGGWPLTMILTHDDQVPFFGGTYFPTEPRFGLPGFKELLDRIVDMYQSQLPAIRKQNSSMLVALEKTQELQTSESSLSIVPVIKAVKDMKHHFDPINGGHTGAPKFPQSPSQEFLLSLSDFENADAASIAIKMASLTLKKMANGGIYDHLGGGFCRYSVDQHWLIPHFEKMLYDNGQLLANYSHALKITNDSSLDSVIIESADWMIRDLQSPDGGYYSSLDADSEGEEGKFYAWQHDELKTALTPEEYETFSNYYGLNDPPNFEGKWHLHIHEPGDDSNLNNEILSSAKARLLGIRNQRIWPGRDEKILTSWNAIGIKGMILAYLSTGDERYFQSASRAMTFIYQNMWQGNRLFASYKDGKVHLNAYLDDYAFLLDAILTLLTAHWDNKWIAFAEALSSVLLEQFYDEEYGGFFFTSHDHETLIQRRKDFMDDATPSGNGIAVNALLRMGHLTGNQSYLAAAESTLKAAWGSIESMPVSHASILAALADFYHPPRQIIIRGSENEISDWKSQCFNVLRDSRTQIYAISNDWQDLPGLLEKRQVKENTVAYVCEGNSCKTPFTNLEQLISDLKHCEIK